MKRIIKHLFILAICLMLSAEAFPQRDKAAASTKKNEQVKENQKKAYEKARKKTIKHRREIQTKETRKRMDETDKQANAYNSQNDKKWYQKIFGKKHRKR